jgi:hypothetical protein
MMLLGQLGLWPAFSAAQTPFSFSEGIRTILSDKSFFFHDPDVKPRKGFL